jgi:hypothetical protein
MASIDLRKEVELDIERYKKLLQMYKSGKAKTGNVDSQGRVADTTNVARHLDNVIRELRALLRDD